MPTFVLYGYKARGSAVSFKLGVAGLQKTISGHNRDFNEARRIICAERRRGDGRLVRDVISEKKEWQFSFRSLPHSDAQTVDNGMGVTSLKSMMTLSLTSVLRLTIPTEDGSEINYDVMFEAQSWKEKIVSRNDGNWKSDVSFTLVEV